MKKIILLLFAIFSSWQINAQIASYGFSQNTGTYTPLTGATILASYTSAADGQGRMNDKIYSLPASVIPFTFLYDGNGYDTVYVSSNGFITFGATLPSFNSYTPLSATTGYAGAISAFGRDLEGGFVFAADKTIDSPILQNVSNLGPAQVGDYIDGTGIPAGATITAISGNTITISANVTTTETSSPCRIGGISSNIKYGVEGTAPNRVFVIQFSNFKNNGLALSFAQDMKLNFQIRLSETTNAINIVYGDCSVGLITTPLVIQVGLRGATNAFATNVNNRKNTKGSSDWANSIPGTANISGQVFNNEAPANVIPTGLTYTWTPPVQCSGTPIAGTVSPSSLNVCSGGYIGNLAVSGYSSGVLGLTFQWQDSPDGVVWNDVLPGAGVGGTTPTYLPNAYSGTPIQFRAKVTCTNSGLFDYSTPALIGDAASPTIQVTNANANNLFGVSGTLNWTNGNGSRRLVVLSESAFSTPVNGSAPVLVANTVYSGPSQQYVYDGTGTTVDITGLVAGTTYYVRVYEYVRCGIGPNFDYFYNVTLGTNEFSFVTPVAPTNDNCSGALPLTVGSNFASNYTEGTILAATTTAGINPTCNNYANADVWYTVTVPASGNLTLETQVSSANSMTDTIVTAYSGTCGALVQVGCDNNSGPVGPNSNMSILTLTGRTPGEVLYVAVWTTSLFFPSSNDSQFLISAYDGSLGNSSFDDSNFSYSPNPVKNTLYLSYNQEISNIEIFNLLGQKVSSNPINSNEGQVDMSNLSNGVYLIKVTSNNQVKTIRIIKE